MYVYSKTKSEEIYFFPDSIALFTQDFSLKEVEIGIEFPQVDNKETFGLYHPYNERYKIIELSKKNQTNTFDKKINEQFN